MAGRRQIVAGGVWDGAQVRTARKLGRCHYWLGSGLGRCPVLIQPGDRYFDGEMRDGHPFARDRYCMAHLGTGTVQDEGR